MNEFELTARNYEAIMERDDLHITKEECESKIRTYRALAGLNDAEILEIFNSGAFNDVLKGYCKMALTNCNIEPDKVSEVMAELKWLLDTMTAEQAKQHA